MLDARAFQQEFGAALAGRRPVADPVLARALAVHRNTSTKAALDALAANYPVLRALVDDEPFAAAARAFADASPPVDPRLCLYGEGFASSISTYAPFAELPYLGDLAAVERLVVEALFAADADPIAPDAIDLSLEASLSLHPALGFAALTSPAASIWRAHQPDTMVALDAIEWRHEVALVTRPEGTVSVTVLPPGGGPFIDALAAGRPLGDAAQAAGEDLADVFSTLITLGAFVSAAHPIGDPT